MKNKLTKEQAAALNATGERELGVIDPDASRDAIAEGLAQMEAGQGKPLDQAFSEMRSRLGDFRHDHASFGS